MCLSDLFHIADYKNNVLLFKNQYYCEKNNNVILLTSNFDIQLYLYLFSE